MTFWIERLVSEENVAAAIVKHGGHTLVRVRSGRMKAQYAK